MSDNFIFNCTSCPATLKVRWDATLPEIAKKAEEEGGWHILKNWAYCGKCKPVLEREVEDE